MDSCDNLSWAKGFGNIVICADFQREDLVDFGVPAADYDDAAARAFGALPDKIQAISIRQAQIDQIDVKRVSFYGLFEPGNAFDNMWLVAFPFQRAP